MLRLCTEEETKARKDRVRRLRRNGRTKDTMKAILMDSHIGGFGLDEDIAEAKADAIMVYTITEVFRKVGGRKIGIYPAQVVAGKRPK